MVTNIFEEIGIIIFAGIVGPVLALITMLLFKGLLVAITKVFEVIDKAFDLILK